MKNKEHPSTLWARFRFAIIGPLLAAPPEHGELAKQIYQLSEKTWTHPIDGQPYKVSVQTIERWLYQARATHDPVGALRRKVRTDSGRFASITTEMVTKLDNLYREYPTWSYQLHYDNLKSLARADPKIGEVPSYPTVRRFMKSQGWIKKKRRGDAKIEHSSTETRSYESKYVNGLWHADFHSGSRKVLLASGEWVTPKILAFMDDRSRICCHAQWYLGETTEAYVHGLMQALQKRGRPRALMSDNGSAMTAHETVSGLERLGITPETTLPYSPHQNGKQEAFWGPLEGRLMKMLKGVPLTLKLLNEATQAWVELDHNQEPHSELGNQTPVERFLDGPDEGRPCPDAQTLSDLFRWQGKRTQRRSDGTLSAFGVRYEIPARYRHMQPVWIRIAQWDKSHVLLVDYKTDQVLCVLYPLDKEKNASGMRRKLTKVTNGPIEESGEIAPYLREMMTEYAATGLPAAYIPLNEEGEEDDE